MKAESDSTKQAPLGSWSRDVQTRGQAGWPSARAKRWPLPAGALLVLAVFGLGTPAPLAGIRRDEIECEEAVAHLAKCCASFNAESHSCNYDDNLGCGDATEPEFSVSKSREIRSMSCAQALASTWCNPAVTP